MANEMHYILPHKFDQKNYLIYYLKWILILIVKIIKDKLHYYILLKITEKIKNIEVD